VILSFGGAGMGGSWAGDNNDYWDYCYGKEESVASQLDTIMRYQNFDGIDIDYEYLYSSAEAPVCFVAKFVFVTNETLMTPCASVISISMDSRFQHLPCLLRSKLPLTCQ